MRIKVQTNPPLPSLKAWFNIHSEQTILQLKRSLGTRLDVLASANARFLLLLDDFQLLDSTEIDVLRDGDCITIRLPEEAPHERKPQIAKSVIPPQPSSSSSSSDSSSESDSDSDSDPNSDSTSTPSLSLVRSNPVDAPSLLLKPKTVTKARPQPSRQIVSEPVPPGQGKAATRSRNLRRRRKKEYNKLCVPSEDANPNTIPVGDPLETRTPETISEPISIAMSPTPARDKESFMMASLSNKNKRKGFKAAMASTRPQKIVFSDQDFPDLKNNPTEAVKPPDTLPRVTRLIPPSEKQECGLLPKNMFVTFIDVEEDVQPPTKKRKQDLDLIPNTSENYNVGTQETNREVSLPTLSAPPRPSKTWSEEDWQKGMKVRECSQIGAGMYLGWKELGIDPSSFTPEILLNVGRVVSFGDKVSVQPVHGIGVAEVFGSEGAEHDASPSEEVYVEYEWPEILSNDWRVVSPSSGL